MPNENEKITQLLPVLPLRGMTAFPNMLIHFDVGRAISIKALEAAMKDEQVLFLTAQKNLNAEEPEVSELYQIGTICIVKQILRLPGDSIRVLVEGRARAIAHEFLNTEGAQCLFAQVEVLPEKASSIPARREQALVRTVQDRFLQYAEFAPRLSADVAAGVQEGGEPGYLADFIAQNIALEYEQKQEILEELDCMHRLMLVIHLLTEETEILKIENEIQSQLKSQIDKNQRDYYLREQIKVIQSELGEQDIAAEAEEYRAKIQNLRLPKELQEKLLRESDRLAKMSSSSAESSVIRTYLDHCLDLPWNTSTKERVSLSRARKILDRDHYGLDKVKERILEFIAVKSLSPQLKGQVLCFVGPPGVGKTSVAKSVAEAMGRNFTRLSLGGVRDEADIRGHRKTYIGAMPGRIITAIQQAKSKNPLLLLDEIDKMGNDFRGDPASAMLEVLDAEQNYAFRDHYIELPFDLSDVLFVTTANDLSTVPRPLLDRMEVVELGSYTEEEKLQIAKKHLLPKELQKHGITKKQLSIADTQLRAVILGYTREAGVRKLEQVLAKICRKAAKALAEKETAKVQITEENMETFLGPVRYKKDNLSKRDEVGIVNGLAWTSVGGEMLQVEVAAVPGTGKIEITGNLGNVMTESAKAAITFVRSRAQSLRIDPMFYKEMDIHIHFPEAAVPKDGPSAGVTMATAIISALTGAPVRHDVAMTGEVTLRGRVLPIGGLKEKTMAAYRADMKTILVPKENASDLDEIEPIVKENVQFVLAETMDTVMQTAIDFSRMPSKESAAEAKSLHSGEESVHPVLPMQDAAHPTVLC